MLGNVAQSLEIGDLPILPANMRAAFNYSKMKKCLRHINLRVGSWTPRSGSGALLAYRLLRVNLLVLVALHVIAAVTAVLFYGPHFFLQKFLKYLEDDPKREATGWGWVWVIAIFSINLVHYLVAGNPTSCPCYSDSHASLL